MLYKSICLRLPSPIMWRARSVERFPCTTMRETWYVIQSELREIAYIHPFACDVMKSSRPAKKFADFSQYDRTYYRYDESFISKGLDLYPHGEWGQRMEYCKHKIFHYTIHLPQYFTWLYRYRLEHVISHYQPTGCFVNTPIDFIVEYPIYNLSDL